MMIDSKYFGLVASSVRDPNGHWAFKLMKTRAARERIAALEREKRDLIGTTKAKVLEALTTYGEKVKANYDFAIEGAVAKLFNTNHPPVADVLSSMARNLVGAVEASEAETILTRIEILKAAVERVGDKYERPEAVDYEKRVAAIDGELGRLKKMVDDPMSNENFGRYPRNPDGTFDRTVDLFALMESTWRAACNVRGKLVAVEWACLGTGNPEPTEDDIDVWKILNPDPAAATSTATPGKKVKA